MRIVFAGTPEVALDTLVSLAAGAAGSQHEVVGVITREDAPLGRKRVLTPSPVASKAEELGIPVYKANRLDEGATEWVRALEADLGVIVAYGGLVREPLLSLPRLGWINLHFSDLPRWRGAAPVQRALMAGELSLGVTVFRLVDELDAGPVLKRQIVDVEPGQPASLVLGELSHIGGGVIARAIELLEHDGLAGDSQVGEPTYAHKLTREDGRLNLDADASQVLAHWAGVTAEPGAFVEYEGQPLKLHELRSTQPTDSSETAIDMGDARPSGTAALVDGRAILQLRDEALELVRVQPAGKAAMSGADWLRGRGGEAALS